MFTGYKFVTLNSFTTLHDIYIDNFTLTRKEFHKLLSGHSLAKGMLSTVGMPAKITATKINADKVSKVDFPQHFLTGQYIPAYDQGHTY